MNKEQWVSLNGNELPPNNRFVLFRIDRGGIYTGYFMGKYFMLSVNGAIDGFGRNVPLKNVTHWSLVEPPKEDER